MAVSLNEGHVMFGKRSPTNALDPPPVAQSNPAAVEVLRVWAAPGSPQQLTLRSTWKNPAAWGLLLVDVARHAAQAYQQEGHDADEALTTIRDMWAQEWSKPTDQPQQID